MDLITRTLPFAGESKINFLYTLVVLFRRECISLGGTLASLHSKEENDFVFNLIEPNSESDGLTWLGANCTNSVCKWDDLSSWNYEYWNKGTRHRPKS